MKFLAWTLLVCLPHLPLHAAEDFAQSDPSAPSGAARPNIFTAHGMPIPARPKELRFHMGVTLSAAQAVNARAEPARATPIARAIARAARKSVTEASVEGYSEVLIACQKSRLVIATMPLMRSDSQQAHCYRF